MSVFATVGVALYLPFPIDQKVPIDKLNQIQWAKPLLFAYVFAISLVPVAIANVREPVSRTFKIWYILLSLIIDRRRCL